VCTGAKSVAQVRLAIEKVVRLIAKTGIAMIKDPEITIQNIVASADLGQKIDLNAIAMAVGLERVEYEPEQFPGLVYRMFEPKVVLLLFGSGKVVCTGGKTPQDIEAAVQNITAELQAAGMMV
jgi:transcription initiation factor TFIID TATA-box-binding protein